MVMFINEITCNCVYYHQLHVSVIFYLLTFFTVNMYVYIILKYKFVLLNMSLYIVAVNGKPKNMILSMKDEPKHITSHLVHTVLIICKCTFIILHLHIFQIYGQ